MGASQGKQHRRLKVKVNNIVMILSFWTDMSGQTVKTQIKQLQRELSDQVLHCLPFHLNLLDTLYGKTTLFKPCFGTL